MSVATESKEAVKDTVKDTGIKVGDAWLRRHWPDDAVSVLNCWIFYKLFFFVFPSSRTPACTSVFLLSDR